MESIVKSAAFMKLYIETYPNSSVVEGSVSIPATVIKETLPAGDVSVEPVPIKKIKFWVFIAGIGLLGLLIYFITKPKIDKNKNQQRLIGR